MFTGIIEELGTVARIEDQGDAVRLTFSAETVLEDVTLGASIAVNGCCLTVATVATGSGVSTSATTGAGQWTADVMLETLKRTSLHAIEVGDRINLERAVTPATRLGGHIVQGHVDGVGKVVSREPSEHWEVVTISLDPELVRYVVEKGSIAVDGISLTVVSVSEDAFTVSLIPETLARTSLGFRAVGDEVNLETDIIAKHVEKLLGGVRS